MRTYGTAVLENRKWCIEAEPHVVLQIKRVFGGVSKLQHGRIQISDTVDNCRNLAWFIDRYPLAVTPSEYLKNRSDEHRERETVVHQLLTGLKDFRSFELAIPPRDYQKVAAELVLASGGAGVLVADDVGLGKSATAICVLVNPDTRPAIVIAPTHLQRQWRDEIKKFAPQLETHIIKTGEPYDLTTGGKKRRNAGQLSLVRPHPDVLICTPRKLVGWAGTLSNVIKTVVFDEVHEYRNGVSTSKGAAAAHLSEAMRYRLGLSATPIFNYGAEIWAVLNILQPGALGDEDEFRREWAPDGKITDPKAFGSYAREMGLMIRRTRSEVGRELPPLTKIVQPVQANAEEFEKVSGSAYELAKIILAQADRQLAKGEQFRAGGEFDAMMRQATGLAKAPFVAEFARMVLENEDKVILFGWHHAVYDIWKEKLKDFKPVLYTGKESANQKDAAKKAFCEGDSRVMIISLRSGSGLDGLQHSGCRSVLFGELDWSPAVIEQCIGRPHRDGQENPIMAYFLVSDSGCDPIMVDVLQLKRQQLDGLRDPAGNTGIERLETTGEHVKKLAEEFIKNHGRKAA